MGFVSCLQLILIVLKVLHLIALPWPIVLLPLIIEGIFILIYLIG